MHAALMGGQAENIWIGVVRGHPARYGANLNLNGIRHGTN